MPDLTCILCGVSFPSPVNLQHSYQGLCPDHWSKDTLREWDRLESARKHLLPSAPDTLTLAEWLAIIASYRGLCALCAIWIPVDGLAASNVVPLCRACYHHKEHSFLSAMDRVRAQLAAPLV